MTISLKSLTLDSIEESPEIQSWLRQFPSPDKPRAMSLLQRLRFVTRDDYAAWVQEKLKNYDSSPTYALYAVRKFHPSTRYLWKSDGSVRPRPAPAQGSEDLVASVILTALRTFGHRFIDTSSLTLLRNRRVHDIILIEDSIGSGKRVSDYIRLMTNRRTFMSWWSYGFITLHVLSLARTKQSEKTILRGLPGSDHGKRKRRVSDKVRFDGDIVYDALDLRARWGHQYQAILDVCESTKKIAPGRRKGFGDVMGNIVFYHSVPNNIPGMLWSSRQGWRPLFPGRALPDWCVALLERQETKASSATVTPGYKCAITDPLLALLLNIRRGIRTKAGLGRRMDYDDGIIGQMLCRCQQAGLVSDGLRLTKAGHDAVKKTEQQQRQHVRRWDRSLYVPSSWCTGQATVQPSVLDDLGSRGQADSAEASSADGDGG